ncbi:type III-A CRISPR-associated protein Cas10/Csm1 [Desulfobacca acetoxidans]|uniref:CRISPR system single-strand-specific deoxyribonuclease Cas10/Csm1 (subtype III-A) n=1 Tax=Desulfobacca acetoxidans (strain ATCC 700848 / DSM 11109 / ASRB2) TaxID=880072 RepID=F2NCY7_DESAR|nr:type III-A CRISPR-associated protein Cas10/Csm1 [Desulfobacca acetoxidans]AEB09561.1 CRISPR-associated protein, Csm1 family [Desulfobacca acetoxidans DSM 11109]
MSKNYRNIFLIQLGGLLHDIGKLLQRAEVKIDNFARYIEDFCPKNNKDQPTHLHAAYSAYFMEKHLPAQIIPDYERGILYEACRHHRNSSDDIFVKSDRLSAGERYVEISKEKPHYKTVPFRSVFPFVEINYAIRSKNECVPYWFHNPRKLKGAEELYPHFSSNIPKTDLVQKYQQIWKGLQQDIEELPVDLTLEHFLLETFYLLQKYCWAIPCDTTREFADISLFDHMRTTAAFAGCLAIGRQEGFLQGKEFLFVTADISGIQDFLFRLARAEGVGGISKRLRGRSFYLSMLSEILGRYLLNSTHLSPANLLFCGGGNLEMLLPNTANIQKLLSELDYEVNQWLLERFGGELQLVIAGQEAAAKEVSLAYTKIKAQMAQKLSLCKRQKIKPILKYQQNWLYPQQTRDLIIRCPSCRITLITEIEEICRDCKLHRRIGEKLPDSQWLLFAPSNFKKYREEEIKDALWVDYGKLGSVILLSGDNLVEEKRNQLWDYQAINHYRPRSSALTYLTQQLPRALEPLELTTEKDDSGDFFVESGQVLSFTTLADMSYGDKLLGVLKMDVDYLGAIFAHGLGPIEAQTTVGKEDLRSISRLATLSRMFSWFFQSQINRLCEEVFQEWKITSSYPFKGSISQIFYTVFAGGDDLFVIGPWDQTLELGRKIRTAFKEYTCHNPNLTISGGMICCKPKYPINLAAREAEEALKEAKKLGKNRFCLSGQAAVWDLEAPESVANLEDWQQVYYGFEDREIRRSRDFFGNRSKTLKELLDWGELLMRWLQEKKIARRLLHRLLLEVKSILKESSQEREDKPQKSAILKLFPFLAYQLARNVKDPEVRQTLHAQLITSNNLSDWLHQLPLPLIYILNKSRQH